MIKKNSKRLYSLGIILLSAAMLSGCGKKDTDTAEEPATTVESTEAASEENVIDESGDSSELVESSTEAAEEDTEAAPEETTESAEESTEKTTEAAAENTDTGSSGESSDIAKQIQVIADQGATWLNSDGNHFYTVTDLDHNGKLEVISACNEGSGMYTYASIYEVNDNVDGLVICSDNLNEGDAYPDFIIDGNFITYTNGEDYMYIASDVIRINGGESWEILDALTLRNKSITVNPLAYSITNENGTTYYNSEDAEISETDFTNMTTILFGNSYQKSETAFKWDKLEGDGLTDKLTACYNAFAGK